MFVFIRIECYAYFRMASSVVVFSIIQELVAMLDWRACRCPPMKSSRLLACELFVPMLSLSFGWLFLRASWCLCLPSVVLCGRFGLN